MTERHLVARAGQADPAVPCPFAGHSAGFRRWAVVDEAAAAHTGFGVCTLEAGGRLDAHVHSFEESVFVLEGGLVLDTAEGSVRLGPGDYGLVPVGVAHAAGTAWSGPAGVVASAAINTLLFLVGFRVLTVRNVPLRSLLPGAVLAAVAWALLQWLGGWYVARQVSRADATYGAFALVIGLLSWLYLAATVTLLAAEVNVVRTRGLWPRSLAPPPLGDADEQVLEDLARQQERLPSQRVEVSFEDAAERQPPAQSG